MSKQTTIVNGITLTRAQVEAAFKDLNTPPPPKGITHGIVCLRKPDPCGGNWLIIDRGKLDAVLASADKSAHVLLSLRGDTFAMTTQTAPIFTGGSGNFAYVPATITVTPIR